jgi:hypothetical protein
VRYELKALYIVANLLKAELTHVEAGSNTSTVIPRVVGEDEKGT